MSTHGQPVAFEHPFQPGETLTGERLGKRYLPGDPYPRIRVRVGEHTFAVEQDDIED